VRGELPEQRLRQIGAALPSAVRKLNELLPSWARMFLGSEAADDAALRGLWDGWDLLCEANIALGEAEACWVWYTELRRPPNEASARYFSRYYLDDAALRMHASSQHMLKAIKAHFDLRGVKHTRKATRKATPLERTIEALTHKNPKTLAVRWLRALNSNPDWTGCEEYRNRWAHNNRPALVGLEPNLTHARLLLEPGFEGFSFGSGPWAELTVEQLRQTCRGAYVALLDVYLKAIKLMSPKRSRLWSIKDMLAP
jgi:hypothetical protein